MSAPDQTHALAELDASERRLQSAIVESDVTTLDAMLDDSVVYTGPDGVALGKEQDLDTHRSGVLDVRIFDTESFTSRVIGDTGLTFIEAALTGTAAGEPFSVRMRYTRTWVRGPGGWVVVAAHASALG